MNSEIQRFRRRVLQFVLLPFVLLIPWLPFGALFGRQLLERAKGPSAATQTAQSFHNALSRDYDVLFLGNSRIYRGINPDQFSVPAYNFACDNDTFDHMYYRLKWLRQQGKAIRCLVMGVDFFQFSLMRDSRNDLYSDYFADLTSEFDLSPAEESELWVKSFVRGLNPKYLFMNDNGRTYLRQNGQFIKPGHSRSTDTVIRSTRRLPGLVQYFEGILSDCREHETSVVLAMLPIRVEEQNAYADGEMEEFLSFIRGYESEDVRLIDLTLDPGYQMADYTDITHLNEAAADRLSSQLDRLVTPLLTPQPDLRRVAEQPQDAAIVR